MHASIRRFHASANGNGELLRQGCALAAALSDMPGFVSFAMLESGPDRLASITIFDDAGGLADGEAALARWLHEHGAALDDAALPAVISGEIVVQRGM